MGGVKIPINAHIMREDITSAGINCFKHKRADLLTSTFLDCAEMLAEAVLLNTIDHDSLFQVIEIVNQPTTDTDIIHAHGVVTSRKPFVLVTDQTQTTLNQFLATTV